LQEIPAVKSGTTDEEQGPIFVAKCWPLLLLPVVQGTLRTPSIAALGAMAEAFSDDFNLKIGDDTHMGVDLLDQKFE
jgi:hypothetical protein